MKKLKFIRFLTIVVIPFMLIMTYKDFWYQEAMLEMQSKISGYVKTMYMPKIEKENSSILGWLILSAFLYFAVFKRWLKSYKDKLEIKEQRKNLFLLILSLVKSVILWGILYSMISWLEVNTDKFFEAIGFLFASIAIGLIFEVLIWLKYLDE